MTRDTYIRMTSTMRTLLSRLPGGLKLLRLPTLIYAAIYPLTLIWLMLMRDPRIVRVLLVPAACFLLVTLIRPIINRQRPYDFFNAAPVGSYRSGKGKSMPSRHTASAAAIAIAVAYVFPHPAVIIAAAALALLIGVLRVLSGQHYISDVLAATLLSILISLIGYSI